MQIQSLEQVVRNVLKRDFAYTLKDSEGSALDDAASILIRHGKVIFNHQGNFTIATILVAREGLEPRVFPGCTRKAHEDKDNRTLAHMTALARAVRLAIKILVHDIQTGRECLNQPPKRQAQNSSLNPNHMASILEAMMVKPFAMSFDKKNIVD